MVISFSRIHSWQAHLQCISSYLVFGEVVWWKENVSGYLFLDGDNDPEYQVGGPTALHFRDSNIQIDKGSCNCCSIK